MGQGYILRCKCGEIMIDLGVGFSYPKEYEKEMEAAGAGKYGEELRALMDEKKYVAMDAENRFYYCDECGYWEVNKARDLYEPKNLKKVLKKKYGEKTVEELGKIPVVINFDDYNLIYKHKHLCPKCHLEMKNTQEIGTKVLEKINCPKCGNGFENDQVSFVDWD